MQGLMVDEQIILEMRDEQRSLRAAAIELFCQISAIANTCAQVIDDDGPFEETHDPTIDEVLSMARVVLEKYQPLVMR